MNDDDLPPDDEAVERLLRAATRRGAPSAGGCPDDAALAALAEGRTPAETRDAVEAHVSRCAECQAVVGAIAAVLPPGAEEAASGTDAAGSEGGSPAPEALPRRLGPYLLRRRLGSGSLGVVYEAVHDARGRPEALKTLDDAAASDATDAERIDREVRALAALRHDHVVPLYDAGRLEGRTYYTMPLLPGPSLAALLDEVRAEREGPPGAAANRVLDRHGVPAADDPRGPEEGRYARRVAALFVGVADALRAVHAAGLVHRDVKPSNLLLDEGGRVRLTDFGIVRSPASTLTRDGLPVGTPAYMSPEQLLRGAGDVDGRADLYGLGGVLFEMLTLAAPHEGRTLAETVAFAARRRVRDVRSANPRVPRDLAVVVGRCLERRRQDRYADAGALRADLAAVAAGRPIAARPLSPVRRALGGLAARPGPAVVAGLAVVVAGVAAGAWWTRPALLTIETVPAASIRLDEGAPEAGPVLERRLEPGTHRVEAVLARFDPFHREVALERGRHERLYVGLRPSDPADPAALATLRAAMGLDRPEAEPEIERAAGSAPVLVVESPRGRLAAPPRRIVGWASEPVEGVRVVLLLRDAGGGDGADVVLDETVPKAFGRFEVGLPAAESASLSEGRSLSVEMEAGPGRAARAEAALLGRDARARIDRRLDEVSALFPPGDPTAAMLRVDVLFAEGLDDAVLSESAALRGRTVPERETARRALLALERLGLRGVGAWAAWAEAYVGGGR